MGSKWLRNLLYFRRKMKKKCKFIMLAGFMYYQESIWYGPDIVNGSTTVLPIAQAR
jgi:hypothetical protein